MALAIIVTASYADVIVIQPDNAGVDSYINSGASDHNAGSDVYMVVGYISTSSVWSLVQWDISGIPAGQDIAAVTMELCCASLSGKRNTSIQMDDS